MDKQKLEALAQQLLNVASVYDPKDALIVKGLLEVATVLNTEIRGIKKNDPEVWTQISNNFDNAVADFNNSTIHSDRRVL